MDSESAEGSSSHCTMAEDEPSSMDFFWIYMQTCPIFSHLHLNFFVMDGTHRP